MKSWTIFAHSLSMVLRNLQQAVQIGLVPSLIAFGVLAGLFSSLGLSYSLFEDQKGMQELVTTNPNGFVLVVLLSLLVIWTTMIWIVVSWHRFVLLEEYPSGWIPPFRLDRILSYIGHGLLLGLVMFAVMFVFGVVAAMLGAFSQVLMPVVMVAGVIAMMVIMYRLVAVLPAAAIGKPLKLSEAWAATADANGTIAGLVVIMVLFQVAVQLVSGLVALVPVVGIIVVFAASMLLSLVGVSVLTTFYGHYIEDRPV